MTYDTQTEIDLFCGAMIAILGTSKSSSLAATRCRLAASQMPNLIAVDHSTRHGMA
ncbi:MAG: hypothetical protein AAGA70_03080 [Pseudomonadota bacterium]